MRIPKITRSSVKKQEESRQQKMDKVDSKILELEIEKNLEI